MRHVSGTEEYGKVRIVPQHQNQNPFHGKICRKCAHSACRKEPIFPASEPEPKEAPRDRGLNASTYQGLPMLVKQARIFPLVCSSHPDSTGVHDTPDGHVICEQSRAMPGLPSRSDSDPKPSGQWHSWRQ